VCLFVCLHVCTVTDFSAAEKDSGVKLRMLVRLLSGMSFSDFGEIWPRGGSSRSLNGRFLGLRLAKNSQLECGPMPNVMAALPNIGGALCL